MKLRKHETSGCNQAMDAQQESALNYRVLFESIVDGAFIIDTETREILHANPVAGKMSGYGGVDELRGMKVADMLPGDELDRVIPEFDAHAAGEKTLALDIPFLRKDRNIIYVDINTTSALINGRKSMVGIFRDVTDRRQMEKSLKEYGANLEEHTNALPRGKAFSEAIINSVPDMLIIIDENRRISYANPAFAQFINRDIDKFAGKSLEQFFKETAILTPESVSIITARVKNRLQTGEPVKGVELEINNASGEVIPVSYSASGIKGADGRLAGEVVLLRDISRQKMLEQEIRKHSRNLEGLVDERTKELSESEQRYSTIVEKGNDGIVIIKKHKIIFANKRIAEMSGYTIDELKEVALDKVVAPESLKKGLLRMQQRFAGKDIMPIYEIELIYKGGKIVPTEISNSIIEYEGERADLVVLRDISDRKHAEVNLRESEDRYQFLFENSIEAVFTVDIDGNFTSVNRAMEEITHYSRKELIGENFKKIVSQETAEFIFKNYNEMFKTEKPIRNILYEIIRKNGDKRLIEGYVNLIKKGGRTQGFQGTHRDITKRKRIEEELLNSEKLLNQTQKLAKIGGWSLDVEKKILSFTEGVFRIAELPLDHKLFSLEPAINYHSPESIPLIREAIKKAMEEGVPFNLELEFITAQGRWVWVRSIGEAQLEDGKVIKLTGTIQDITERRKAEEERLKLETQLRQAQKMESIGTLAGGIAHDFNNILVPIIGYTEITMNSEPEESAVRKNLNEVLKGAMRAKDLVQQILTFSRQQGQELKPLKIQLVVKEALKFIRSSLPTTIGIHQDIENDCGLVMADPTQIHQLVMNLCTNAFHAMEENGGMLEVNLNEVELQSGDLADLDMGPGPYICLKVADSGHGMGQDLMERIFDPYFTTKEPGKGTGLGLAVVHGIVKKIGGDIRVYSEQGKGTVFHIYLPVKKGSIVSAATGVNEIFPVGDEHILLVDDEETIVAMEKQMIEGFGYQLTTRTSSIEALEAFRKQPDKFDLVITDMTMPNMTGDKLSAELLEIRPDIPIIICTGFSENISEKRADVLGIKGFLMKPIVMKELARMIREALDDG